MRSYLDFEKPVAELEAKADELRGVAESSGSAAIAKEIEALETRAEAQLKRTLCSADAMAEDDGRAPSDAAALPAITWKRWSRTSRRWPATACSARTRPSSAASDAFAGSPSASSARRRARTPRRRLRHNFGMAMPEGYRKAVRLMELADRFDVPVLSFVDTAGAYPGIAAEERGQAEAIARSTDCCLSLGVPNCALVIGEGGSGGAVAIASCNTVLMLEHAIYTVASPEASASILWRDSARAQDAATNMKITAQDLLRFGVIDGIVPEPAGGAHRDPAAAVSAGGRRARRPRWPILRAFRATKCATNVLRSSWPSAGRPRAARGPERPPVRVNY